MDNMKTNIDVAMKRIKAPLVLKNASIVNVFTQTIEKGDIAITDNIIAGIGHYDGIREVDCRGLFAAPGLIDAHVHIESSMVTPELFSKLVIKRGVTTIIADPHEIANVLGEDGIEFMLENSKKGAVDTFFMLPSCVPAVDFEDNGAELDATSLTKFIAHPNVLGLGEVMDVNAVVTGNHNMLKKITMTKEIHKNIDGHCPRININELNAYLCSGVNTDHECGEPEEALEKVKNGMYVMLREGSAARNLINLLPAVNKENYHRFLFCTDDRHIEDLMEEGSIDNCVRLAIKNGLEPVKAYTMASLNAAACYNLRDRGAIAAGMKADLIIFENLEELNIKTVIKDGKIYEDSEEYSKVAAKASINLNSIKEELFKIKSRSEFINVIKVIPGSLETLKVKRKVVEKDGYVEKLIEVEDSINKVAVIERHKNSGKHFTGFIEGLGLKGAAMAQSIAHDSHNIIVMGDSDKDMEIAVNNIISKNGGIVFAAEGKLLEYLSLPIAGLMTDENPSAVLHKIRALNLLAKQYGIKDGIDPFLTLAFMALPVIPDLKITPKGLFEYCSFKFIDLFNEM